MHLTKRLPRETGRDYALRTIKDNIIRLELAPGSMVSENELSTEMGLSRTPVREALIELSKSKIVEIYPQKGSAVSLVDYTLVEESRFVRSVLEGAVVELVCTMALPEDIQRLEDSIQLQIFYRDHRDPDALLEPDDMFHHILFEIAQKPQAYALMENIAIHFDRMRRLSLFTVKNSDIIADHQALLSDIIHRDPAAARARLEIHLNRYKIDEQAIRAKFPDYFK
ncbi:MAG: GntR family transcriptional regulator [Pseudoflavonifractor sp.]